MKLLRSLPVLITAFGFAAMSTAPLPDELLQTKAELKRIRAMPDSLERLREYDRFVDSLKLKEAPRADLKTDTSRSAAEKKFLQAQAKVLKQRADDYADLIECSSKIDLEFDPDKKRALAVRGVKIVEDIEAWSTDQKTLKFAKEHGTPLGEDFYVFFVGRRSIKQGFIDQSIAIYGLTYLGTKKWKVAQVNWRLEDLLGDNVGSGAGKLNYEPYNHKVNLVSIEENIFKDGPSHITDWEDAKAKPGSAPKVVWAVDGN